MNSHALILTNSQFVKHAIYIQHTRDCWQLSSSNSTTIYAAIILAVTEGPVREEQLLHDMCLLGAVTVEITQILTRAGLLT